MIINVFVYQVYNLILLLFNFHFIVITLTDEQIYNFDNNFTATSERCGPLTRY